MTELRVRDQAGAEHTFTRDQLVQAVTRGVVSGSWEIFHAAAGRWLPISVHPAFRQAQGSGHAASQRSPRLVLIYPEAPAVPPVPASQGDEPEPLSLLSPEEIERVLHPGLRPPGGAEGRDARPRGAPGVSSSELADVLLRTARRRLPTFSRAVSVAADLVAPRGKDQTPTGSW